MFETHFYTDINGQNYIHPVQVSLKYYNEVPTWISHKQKRILLLGRCLPCSQAWYGRGQRIDHSLMAFIRTLILLKQLLPRTPYHNIFLLVIKNIQAIKFTYLHKDTCLYAYENIHIQVQSPCVHTQYTLYVHLFVHINSWFWALASFYPVILQLVFLVYVHIRLALASEADLLTPGVQECVTHSLAILWQP